MIKYTIAIYYFSYDLILNMKIFLAYLNNFYFSNIFKR